MFLLSTAFAADPELSRTAAWEPAEVSADFDGDGKLDRAEQIADAQGRVGIRFRMSTRPDAVVIGAGVAIGNGGEDLAWVERWSIRVDDRRAALLLESESGGGGVRWNGRKFVWRQFGD